VNFISRGLCGLFLMGIFAITSCSLFNATKSQDAVPPTGSGIAPPGSQAPGKSGLEALRAGEPPSTPSSSPLKDIYFDFDRYDLRPDMRAVIKANADWLEANLAVPVQIEGYCDERGTTEYNLALGAKRAEAVKNFLVSLGIAASRISTISYGNEVQVCHEHREECWKKNRRARFVAAVRPRS
jgi:peptidoglycan-associated lipoprotein